MSYIKYDIKKLDQYEYYESPDDEYIYYININFPGQSGFFFDKNKLWDICDKGIDDATITALTKRINGGVNGLDHRKALTIKYFGYIK